jgi:hypothetical protein
MKAVIDFDASSSILLTITRVALTTIAAYIAAVYPDRPRGRSSTDLIEVRDSPIQGKGVFAKQTIPDNTIIGTYPGRPRTGQAMTLKAQSTPLAAGFCFKNKLGLYLDPTNDSTGLPSPYPKPGLPWPLPVDVTLSYCNEPPLGGGGCNVIVEDDASDEQGLVFVSAREIRAGEEILVDYGLNYDRSGYGSTINSNNNNNNKAK